MVSSNDVNACRGLSLKTKFFMATAAVLLTVTVFISFFVYYQYRRTVLSYAYEKTRLLMAEAEAARKYVKDILRPKMYAILPRDKFIVEAMSTSFVARKVMGKVAFLTKGMIYKRASANPRNLQNAADPFERRMIEVYNTTKSLEEWQGIVTRDGRKWFVSLQPIYTERSCLRCHGDPEDSPSELLDRYGRIAGFYREVGKVAGLDEVAIPVDRALKAIHNMAFGILAIGLGFVFVLFVLVGLFFDRLVYVPLRNLATFCRNIEKGEKGLNDAIPVTRRDEIGQLADSFNALLKHLHDVQEKLVEYSEGLEELVARRTFELNRNKKFLEAILSTSPVGFLVVDRTGRISLWNGMAARITGLHMEQIMGKRVNEVPLPIPVEYITESFQREEEPKEREYCFMDTQGSRTYILVNQSFVFDDKHRQPTAVVVNFFDITEMKRLHEELDRYTTELETLIDEKVAQLRESEEKYREIFENANDAIVFLDSPTLEIIDANPAWVRLCGFPREEVIGRPLVEFLVPEDLDCAQKCFEKSRSSACTLEILNSRGRRSVVELISSSFTLNGRSYVMSIIRDITPRKRLEERLIETNLMLRKRNRALREMTIRLTEVEEDARRQFAAILHDKLGQDLAAIKINIGMLIQHMARNGGQCVSDLKKVQELLGNVISVTRDLTSEMYPTILDNLGLAPAVHWYLEKFSSKFGIQTSFRKDGEVPRLDQEVETLLFRFVQEALLNCAKHADSPVAQVSMSMEDSELTIRICDEGKGFDPRVIERREKAGIGLAIIRERMTYLGGSMAIESEMGMGTTVILRLPIEKFHRNGGD